MVLNSFILDDFLSNDLFQRTLDELDNIDGLINPSLSFIKRMSGINSRFEHEMQYESDYLPSDKRFVVPYDKLGSKTKEVIDLLQSDEFISYISNMFKINLFCQKDNLRGGGLQVAKSGAYMDLHLDNNWNANLNAYTAANAILYLNRVWEYNWGGSLNLHGKYLEQKILPIGNRLVSIRNTEDSYHGYPEKINCPENVTRNALVIFYYTKENLNVSKRATALWKTP